MRPKLIGGPLDGEDMTDEVPPGNSEIRFPQIVGLIQTDFEAGLNIQYHIYRKQEDGNYHYIKPQPSNP